MKRGFGRPGRNTELQADYLAGWYFAQLHARDPRHFESNAAIEDGVYAFYSRGDYQFNSPHHHGTREQRRAAFLNGFRAGAQPFETAWRGSIAYRGRLGG
jgi:predicted metalloprotease